MPKGAQKMRVAIASDHGGFGFKEPLVRYIESLGYEVEDCGPDSFDRVDYPDYADIVARKVANQEADYGVLICGTGLGMAITADKVAGVRAATVTSHMFAKLARQHNNANVLCLSGRFVSLVDNMDFVRTFLGTAFEGGRHERRIKKIMREDDPNFTGVTSDR